MIYTDIYKNEMEQARVHAACINETAMAFARMLDECVTVAQFELGARVYPTDVLGYQDPIGMTIAFGKSGEINEIVAKSEQADESLVSISITRYWGMDHDEYKYDFNDEPNRRRAEKYDIAFQIDVFVGKVKNETDDPEEISVEYPSVSTMVVFIKKYPAEILESDENFHKFISERYINDFDCYEVSRDDEGERVLTYVPDGYLSGGYNDIPEKYRDAYGRIMEIINDYLKEKIG